jgi:hypothetical protein
VRVLVLAFVVAVIGCGGHPSPPPHGVIQADLGPWKYRRYQPVLDVEVWVDNNKAEAFTASYVADAAEQAGHIAENNVVNVFVTRYTTDIGVLRETVKFARRLAAEQGYQVDESKISGARTLTINGHGESWVMWASKGYVVKVGGRGLDSVPSGLVGSYADRYPSVMPGGVLEGPLPPGPDDKPKQDAKQPYDSNNPTPDLDKYDPNKSKLPAKKKED